MSAHIHHTARTVHPQHASAADTAWASEVVPSLPVTLAAQAQALGAFQRTRAFATPSDLLRGLLAYVLCAPAFRQLGIWGVLSAVADVSDTAWRKRLRHASAWLLWLLGELLPSAPARPWLTQRLRGRVWLVDATTIAQFGGTGDDWRLHLGYDLLAGRMGQVLVTDRTRAENLEHLTFQPGDLIVADGAYGYRRMLACAQRQQADVVLRIVPATFPLERSTGAPLDLVAWLGRGGPAVRSLRGYAVWEQQRYQVRVVAVRLSETQQRSAASRVRRKAAQHGRVVSETTLFLSGWMVLVSTLVDESWTDAEIVALYRARWQVELVFKRMKQLVRLHSLRARTAATAEATLRAVLVAWALQERQSETLQQLLRATRVVVRDAAQWRWTTDDELSVWRLTALTVEVLRQQVRGSWSQADLQRCLPRLRRFLLSHPRQREHQASQTWAWLTGVCFTQAAPHQDTA